MESNKFPFKIFIFLGLSVAGWWLTFNQAFASTFYAGSAQQVVYEKQTFVVDWFLNTQERSVNVVNFHLRFSPETLEPLEVSAAGSLVSLWVNSPSVVAQGEILAQGGIPGGITGAQVPILRTVFSAKKSGPASFGLIGDSQVLLSDGLGTPDEIFFKPINFMVMPQSAQLLIISSITHPNQDLWYSANYALLHFTPHVGFEYSYSFSSNLDLIPEPSIKAVPESIEYKNLPDGVYYFKVNSKEGANTWQEVGVFRVQIDSTPPENFMPTIAREATIFNNRPFLSFFTIDKTSGLAGYQIRLGLLGKFHSAQSPFLLSKPLVGDNLILQAIDRAGNIKTIALAYQGYLSVKQFYILLVLVICLFLGLLLLYKYRFKYKVLK